VVTLSAPNRRQSWLRGRGEYDLPAAKVAVALLFTALDGKPLTESQHILVTAMARDKQTNAEYNADGTQLTAIGAAALMEPVQATITLKAHRRSRLIP
jgi:hypothetical protein